MSGLRERLREAVGAEVRYLEEAAIIESDVRSLTSEFILEKTGFQRGNIDLIAGGPPCQPFSRAGKRELVESDTGQLFLDFVRLVRSEELRVGKGWCSKGSLRWSPYQ